MKKFLPLLLIPLVWQTSKAEENTDPYVVYDMIAMSISQNGKYVVSQDYYGATYVLDTQTKELVNYDETYPGNGNVLSDNGILVGQTIMDEMGLIMWNGKVSTPKPLLNLGMSTINAITNDGTRVCGWVADNGSATYVVPYVMDLAEDGSATELKYLPYPDKDFFGDAPQFVNAIWISDDGKTIIGQVVDSSGFFNYPIVYKADSNDNWTYSLPSESLFNPDKIDIPKWPRMPVEKPQIYNYMTSANKERWLNDVKDYEETGNGINPWDNISDYMSEEEYSQYEYALDLYETNPNEYFNYLIDRYWEDMAKITSGANFAFGTMALNTQGDIMAASIVVEEDSEGFSDVAGGYKLCVFNLKDNSHKIINSKYINLLPKQILEDGTVVCVDPAAYCTFFLLPGSDEVITFDEFLNGWNPSIVTEMKDFLGTTYIETVDGDEEVTLSGYLSFNLDNTLIAGGYIGYGAYLTYLLEKEMASVKSIDSLSKDGKNRVFDLYGRKFPEINNLDQLNSLKKGIYIMNGKKIMVK